MFINKNVKESALWPSCWFKRFVDSIEAVEASHRHLIEHIFFGLIEDCHCHSAMNVEVNFSKAKVFIELKSLMFQLKDIIDATPFFITDYVGYFDNTNSFCFNLLAREAKPVDIYSIDKEVNNEYHS